MQMKLYESNDLLDGLFSEEERPERKRHWLDTPTGVEGEESGYELELVVLLFQLPKKKEGVAGKTLRRVCEVSGLYDHEQNAFCPL